LEEARVGVVEQGRWLIELKNAARVEDQHLVKVDNGA
jgi:hypothetical protein